MVRFPLLLLSEMELPPTDAALKLSVQKLDPPAGRFTGVQFMELSAGMVPTRLRTKLAELLPKELVMVADWLLDTVPVLAVKVAVVALAGMATEPGTPSRAVVVVRTMVAPVASAGLFSVTVQVVLELAARLVAPHCRDETAGWLTRLNDVIW
jgi:hypothetical protein